MKIMKEHYKFFSNQKCEYFRCHKLEEEDFNCLFCYCPLYPLGEQCGGNFVYTKNGIKDCQNCTIPHQRDSYDFIQSKCQQLLELGKRKNGKY